MDVERAARRDIEQALRKNEAIRGNHKRLGAGSGDALDVIQGFGLKEGQAAFDGTPLDRARARLQATPGRPVGPREHQRDVVAGVEQARQRHLGE